MKKRIACFLLSAVLCLCAAGCSGKNKTTLTVGVEELGGDLYPFSVGTESDEAVKDMIFTRLIELDEGGHLLLGAEGSSVSDSLRIFYTASDLSPTDQYVNGGCTAFELTLKNGLCFSDGTPLTAEDVMFSVYCAIDTEAGYLSSQDIGIVGLDNYIGQSAETSRYLKLAGEILEKGRDYAPTEQDGFTSEDAALYWSAFDTAGLSFVSSIVDYVTENYCFDEPVSSYIFEGCTGESVKNSEALKCTYAMRLWNYGNYTYSYVPDENGIYVGVCDENGVYSYKTTLDKAMGSEDYTEYVADESGVYVYDAVSGKYRLSEEGDTGKRYVRVLSDKFSVLSRSALTGFRDMAGNLYSLEGEDYPHLSDFFSLMCIAYSTDGVIDYQRMESVEAAKEGDSFTKDAAETFARQSAEGCSVESVEGIKHEALDSGDKVTVYVEGNKWDALYSLDIAIASKEYFTEGFEYGGLDVVCEGVPLSSQAFAAHLREKAKTPVGAGAYKPGEICEEPSSVTLEMNKKFNSVASEYIAEDRYQRICFVDIGGRTAKAINEGEVDICLVSDVDVGEGITEYFVPDFSYDYVLINPAHYININTRRALLSVMDTALVTGGDDSKIINCSVPNFTWVYDREARLELYDESCETAKGYFEAAGYTLSEAGELIDPATKQRAVFELTLLPSAKGTGTEAMFIKATELLNGLGAKASVVYDEGLLFNIYSDRGVGIYSLGWETDMGGSLYTRYAYDSTSDSVKANGLSLLYEGGQIDNFGTVSFTDGDGNVLQYNQADATAILSEFISAGDNGGDGEEKKAAYTKALALIRELSFELPVCQRGSSCYVNGSTVSLSSLNEEPTVFSSVISRPWRITPAGQTDGQDT